MVYCVNVFSFANLIYLFCVYPNCKLAAQRSPGCSRLSYSRFDQRTEFRNTDFLIMSSWSSLHALHGQLTWRDWPDLARRPRVWHEWFKEATGANWTSCFLALDLSAKASKSLVFCDANVVFQDIIINYLQPTGRVMWTVTLQNMFSAFVSDMTSMEENKSLILRRKTKNNGDNSSWTWVLSSKLSDAE